MKQIRRALRAVFVLGGFANALALALPLYALHAFESVNLAAGFETLALLTLFAALAALTFICLMAARDRILLRAGLWLDHTLGQYLLERAERLALPPADLEGDAKALAHLRDALVERSVLPALDAPWLPVFIVALVLIHPILGGLAALSVLFLLLAAIMQAGAVGRLERQRQQAAERTETWWRSAVPATGTLGLAAGAANEWERLNRAHVAGAYALGKRRGVLGDLARVIAAGSQITLIAVGAWLIARHELAIGALLACILIHARIMDQLGDLLASLKSVRRARHAYRRLKVLPEDPATSRADASSRPGPSARPTLGPALPRLNLRAPLGLGFAAIVLFAIALGATAVARLGDLAGLAGLAVFEAQLTRVQHAKGGTAVRVHVTEGATVRAGEVLITLDTAALDRQIAELKTQAEAAKSQLVLIGREALALVGPMEPLPAERPRLLRLEARIAQLETEAASLLTLITQAEQELANSEIRAPVSGRVVSLRVEGPRPAITPGATVLEIATADRTLLDRLVDPILRNIQRTVATVESWRAALIAAASQGSEDASSTPAAPRHEGDADAIRAQVAVIDRK